MKKIKVMEPQPGVNIATGTMEEDSNSNFGEGGAGNVGDGLN